MHLYRDPYGWTRPRFFFFATGARPCDRVAHHRPRGSTSAARRVVATAAGRRYQEPPAVAPATNRRAATAAAANDGGASQQGATATRPRDAAGAHPAADAPPPPPTGGGGGGPDAGPVRCAVAARRARRVPNRALGGGGGERRQPHDAGSRGRLATRGRGRVAATPPTARGCAGKRKRGWGRRRLVFLFSVGRRSAAPGPPAAVEARAPPLGRRSDPPRPNADAAIAPHSQGALVTLVGFAAVWGRGGGTSPTAPKQPPRKRKSFSQRPL